MGRFRKTSERQKGLRRMSPIGRAPERTTGQAGRFVGGARGPSPGWAQGGSRLFWTETGSIHKACPCPAVEGGNGARGRKVLQEQRRKSRLADSGRSGPPPAGARRFFFFFFFLLLGSRGLGGTLNVDAEHRGEGAGRRNKPGKRGAAARGRGGVWSTKPKAGEESPGICTGPGARGSRVGSEVRAKHEARPHTGPGRGSPGRATSGQGGGEGPAVVCVPPVRWRRKRNGCEPSAGREGRKRGGVEDQRGNIRRVGERAKTSAGGDMIVGPDQRDPTRTRMGTGTPQRKRRTGQGRGTAGKPAGARGNGTKIAPRRPGREPRSTGAKSVGLLSRLRGPVGEGRLRPRHRFFPYGIGGLFPRIRSGGSAGLHFVGEPCPQRFQRAKTAPGRGQPFSSSGHRRRGQTLGGSGAFVPRRLDRFGPLGPRHRGPLRHRFVRPTGCEQQVGVRQNGGEVNRRGGRSRLRGIGSGPPHDQANRRERLNLIVASNLRCCVGPRCGNRESFSRTCGRPRKTSSNGGSQPAEARSTTDHRLSGPQGPADLGRGLGLPVRDFPRRAGCEGWGKEPYASGNNT